MSEHTPLIMKFNIPISPVEVLSKGADPNTINKYIVKPQDHVNFELPYMDPCIVDLQLLLKSDEELHKFQSILSSWGAIQLVNHGIKDSTLDQLLEVTKEFFHLPIEEKEKYARASDEEWDFNQIQGWGTDSMGEGQALNWNDNLFLLTHPAALRKLDKWPDRSLPKFREIVDEYMSGLLRIQDTLVEAVSKTLNLPEDNMLHKYVDEGYMISKFNYYPTSPNPNQILGVRAHTDSTIFTLVLQDKEVEGLQLEKDEQWYKVPIVPNAIVLNVSDMLEIMTNGRLKSPVHRVVTDAHRERISIAFAVGPPSNFVIGPLKELIDEKNPVLYPTLNNSTSVTANYFAQGKIFIKEIRKFGPNIVNTEGEPLKKEAQDIAC